MRCWFASSLALTALLAAVPGAAEDPVDPLGAVERELDSMRIVEARELLQSLDPVVSRQPRARYLRGRLLYFEGRYREALVELRASIEGARAELGWKLLRDQIEIASRAFQGLETKQGPSGKFVYRFAPGVDRLLVPYADRALSAQLDALSAVYDDRPRWKIEIDLLPDVETLAAASGLSAEQIERTGTVGVTKYGRIMVLTPRVLANGFPWLDTLAHELTHVMIARASRGRAPIWLHEGIAKLHERLWRGQSSCQLSPEEAYLLDRAARERRLIPLRRFHPSVAHLPNQEDATLAYAQVLSFLSYLDQRIEGQWLPRLLAMIGSGQSVDEAFVALTQSPLRRHYTWWRQAASGIRQTPVPAVGLMERRFKRGAATGQPGLESVLDLDVRRHLRVGDLLRLRGHVKAATIQFQRALSLADSPSPAITDRLAACLLDLGNHQEAAELLTGAVRLYPAHAEAFVQLGRALAAQKQRQPAAEALERGNAVNPFHPGVHCLLAEQYRELGRDADANLESAHCRLLAAGRTEPRAPGAGAAD
jgi:tetratricopeptide (TPR) repeat protein